MLRPVDPAQLLAAMSRGPLSRPGAAMIPPGQARPGMTFPQYSTGTLLAAFHINLNGPMVVPVIRGDTLHVEPLTPANAGDLLTTWKAIVGDSHGLFTYQDIFPYSLNDPLSPLTAAPGWRGAFKVTPPSATYDLVHAAQADGERPPSLAFATSLEAGHAFRMIFGGCVERAMIWGARGVLMDVCLFALAPKEGEGISPGELLRSTAEDVYSLGLGGGLYEWGSLVAAVRAEGGQTAETTDVLLTVNEEGKVILPDGIAPERLVGIRSEKTVRGLDDADLPRLQMGLEEGAATVLLRSRLGEGQSGFFKPKFADLYGEGGQMLFI